MFLVFASQQMQQLARNWYLYSRVSHSPLMLGLLGLANGLPMVLFSLLGGALADRFSKKLMIMVSMTGMALSSLFVALVIASGAARGAYWQRCSPPACCRPLPRRSCCPRARR
jgi:MFS family permease